MRRSLNNLTKWRVTVGTKKPPSAVEAASGGRSLHTRIAAEPSTKPCRGQAGGLLARSFELIAETDTLEVAFVREEHGHVAGRKKLFMIFQVLTPGQTAGAELFYSCNMPPHGRWARSSKYYEAWVLAAGRAPGRLDRLTTAVFRGKYFRAKIRTVERSWTNTPHGQDQRYSIIDRLEAVVAGAPTHTAIAPRATFT